MTSASAWLLPELAHRTSLRRYDGYLTAIENRKGVVDIDTVKGCTHGMAAHPDGGCYNECYAYKIAMRYGFDFRISVSRKFMGHPRNGFRHLDTINKVLQSNRSWWYRIGTAGDPCHDWPNTLRVCEALRPMAKVPVIITKHWVPLSDAQVVQLRNLNAVVNTSVSALDTGDELAHRLGQLQRLKDAGVKSVCRVVTCDFTDTLYGKARRDYQDYLLSLHPVIDNPLRACRNNRLVQDGHIRVTRRNDAIGGGKIVSLHSGTVFLGTCENCPDQCGVDDMRGQKNKAETTKLLDYEQPQLFAEKIEFRHVPTVIGSGYEQDVAKLAMEDGIAHRAARKNMQIHSAIILLINGEFTGFMTFQDNHTVREFCLLQSVIRPDRHTDALYKQLVVEVIKQNTSNYPAIITTDPRSKFETPALFESLGFITYLKMSGFHYMVKGDLSAVRHKLLAHITMCNVWDSTKGEWIRIKGEWKERIEEAGTKYGIPNPMYATRDGCWQGTNGFANVVTGHSHNGNASVLDSTACEVILRFFMPSAGRRIYNPFGGGVQFGFVAGSYGYEYLASEIRQNQCDANNALCKEFSGVRWTRANSATFEPDGMFDLIFTCPPYFKVEKYLDYDGAPPDGEINSMSTYEEFRDALFAGYDIAIRHLNDECFFVVMTGDSRDKYGAYHCSEAETELFFKNRGLSVYNKIVYLEGEFTRLAHAKKTLNMRKFPKREQKIIVAYRGDIDAIKDRFPPVGRL